MQVFALTDVLICNKMNTTGTDSISVQHYNNHLFLRADIESAPTLYV